MPVQELEIRQLGPFDEIGFQFDEHVNVFIGPNNCGKSTILMALAEAIVCPFSVPERLYRYGEQAQLLVTLWDRTMQVKQDLPRAVHSEDVAMMKELGYTGFVPALRENTGFRPQSPMGDGTREPRVTRSADGYRIVETTGSHGVADDVMLSGMPPEISALPRAGRARATPDQPILSEEEKDELRKRSTWTSNSPSVITDQAIVSKIVELDYRAYRKNDLRFRKVVEVGASIASEIMSGFALGFGGIDENGRGLYPKYDTPDGSLPLDKLSQGTQSVIQWVSHLILGMAEYYDFPADLPTRPAVLIIDEIDAHMHPAWQRRIIPTLTKNLPNCQFFVSTHSPLILSGLREGQVQLLSRDSGNRVVVSTNEQDTVGWSVDEIMRWLMGMKGTYDSETERVATELARLRNKTTLTESEQAELDALREDIRSRLLPAEESDANSGAPNGQA